MCHNRRVKVEMAERNVGCQGWTALKPRPALPAMRFAARSDSSARPTGITRGISDLGFLGFHGCPESFRGCHPSLCGKNSNPRYPQQWACPFVFAPIFLFFRAGAGSLLRADRDEANCAQLHLIALNLTWTESGWRRIGLRKLFPFDQSIPIIYSRHIRHWHTVAGEKPAPDLTVAWTGVNPAPRSHGQQ